MKTSIRLGGVAVAAVLVGVATSFGQTVISDSIAPLSNSAGTWCLIASCLSLVTKRAWIGALIAPASLGLMVAGYYLTSSARGFGVSTTSIERWIAVAVFLGPFLGAGVIVLASRTVALSSVWRGCSVAPLSAVFLGEALHGISRLSDSTPVVYWIVEGMVGIALMAGVLVWRTRGIPARLAGGLATVLGTVTLWAAMG
jgi:hypothetical protein